MSRIDQVSLLLRAPAARVYAAFTTAEVMARWLAPEGMAASFRDFRFEAGGGYRLRMQYLAADTAAGKTEPDADEVIVRILRLVPDRRIEQVCVFDSPLPEFAGEMLDTWTFEERADGTLVTVRCENVPPGIAAEDHQAGIASTLRNLAAFVEAGADRQG